MYIFMYIFNHTHTYHHGLRWASTRTLNPEPLTTQPEARQWWWRWGATRPSRFGTGDGILQFM